MSYVFTELVALKSALIARGIPATLDPRDLDAPAAIVELARIGSDSMLCGDYSATATVYLVAPDNGREVATQTLIDMYDKVRDLTTGAEPVDLALPDTAPLPALRLNPIDLT